jgi:hypothetical protein
MSPGLVMSLTIAAVAALALGAVIIRKLDVIHVLVNSNLTAARNDLEAAVGEIGKLREELGMAKQEAHEVRGDAGPQGT